MYIQLVRYDKCDYLWSISTIASSQSRQYWLLLRIQSRNLPQFKLGEQAIENDKGIADLKWQNKHWQFQSAHKVSRTNHKAKLALAIAPTEIIENYLMPVLSCTCMIHVCLAIYFSLYFTSHALTRPRLSEMEPRWFVFKTAWAVA